MSTIQTQFDIVGASTLAKTVIGQVVQNFGKLLPQCFKEDIQPLVIPPLERLGTWLMVDADRLRQGEDAFGSIAVPKLWSWNSISILIGLHNDPKDSLVKTIRCNNHLIGIFLFLGGCSTCLTTDQSSELMHELMRLNEILNHYPIPGSLVRQFTDVVNGCVEYITKKTPFDEYHSISSAICRETAERGRPIHDLNMAGDPKELAKLIYEGIENLRNLDIQLIVLQGTRNGAWVASLFIWLRPKEVEVLVRGIRIYSPVVGQDHSARNLIRLCIRLEESKENPLNSSWSVKSWTKARELMSAEFSLKKDPTDMDFNKQHRSPLKSARDQISTIIPSQSTVDAIGHLAAALVITATELGYLYNKNHKITEKLIQLCSDEFLSDYNGLLVRFGWEKFLGQDLDRVKMIVEALSKVVNDEAFSWNGRDNVDILGRFIYRAFSLLDHKHSSMSGSDEDSVIEFATHVAAEGLLFALCAKIPRYPHYRPLEAFKLEENARMIRQLLQPRGEPRGYSFWELRKRATEALVPGAAIIQPTDLAVASNGYVVYSAALAGWDKELTKRRNITSLYLLPGPLKAVGVEGRLSRLTEDTHNPSVAGRLINYHKKFVKLYEGEQCSLDERDSKNGLSTEILHLCRTENGTGTMHLATHVQVGLGNGVPQLPGKGDARIATSWERSIDALTFARHVEIGNSRTVQLKQLAHNWDQKGYLGSGLQWCPVGMAIGRDSRYITMTSENEQLRFFEAGNLVDDHKIFIKHRYVSLFECIKVAMESCQENECWVIIA